MGQRIGPAGVCVNAPAILRELRAEGVAVRAEGGELVVRAPRGVVTPKLRARLVTAKPELLATLRAEQAEDDAAYAARVLAWERGYVTAVARAYGHAEEVIARACEALVERRGAFRVTPTRIEIELADVKAVFA